ncbi:MAG: UDP-N-acetylglucosamine 2-epimerase (non-hydrolyzing) [Gemmatimonadetes bacterium]|nr:UDP-N-acetylglucosamine 2-epimerase (non-hydrolyzing) [Gemmatimonadota bacterium]
MTEPRARVLVVVGTRPEAIKMAPVWDALRAYAPDLETRVCLTGQHTTLVDQVLDAFRMKPDYDLGIMKEGQTLYDVVHGALEGVREVVRAYRPDVLLVQGDTATVFVGALVAFFEGVRVGHVEAGLRSHDKWAPFPEEIFRRLCDVLTDFYFAPTIRARDALLAEGVSPAHVQVTGNTVVDALLAVSRTDRTVKNDALASVLSGKRRLVLLTAHRRESFGEPIREVFGAVRELADARDDIEVIYPVHPNPNVRVPAAELLSGHPRVHLTDPLDYLDLVTGLQRSALVLTDSGGIQEEAPTFGVPVLVLREVTERPEGIDAGVAELVGTDRARILRRSLAALERIEASPLPNPYGDGMAGERIADILAADLLGGSRRLSDWAGPDEVAAGDRDAEGGDA